MALTFSGALAGLTAKASLILVRPVLRRQSELPAGFVVSPRLAGGWVLDFRAHVLPEDMGPHEHDDEYEAQRRPQSQTDIGPDRDGDRAAEWSET